MDLTLHVPGDLADRLSEGGDLVRRVLEAFAADECRHRWLARSELEWLLGIENDSGHDGFLKDHDVWVGDTVLRNVERFEL